MTPAPRSTPNHCHEQSLVGWKGVLHQCTGMGVGRGDGGDERRGLRRHTALCIKCKVLEIQPLKILKAMQNL